MDLYNLDHEIELISAIVFDPAVLDDIQIKPTDLYDNRNIEILQVVQRLVAEGRKPDYPLIHEYTQIEPEYLAKIRPVTMANVEYYADSVKRFSRIRQLHKFITVAGEKLQVGKDPEEIIEFVEKGLTALTTDHSRAIESLAELLPKVIEELEQRYRSQSKLSGIPSGIDKLDQITGGFQRGEFIVIGARPSIGKTALALTIARNAASEGYPVGFFSLEQSQSVLRLLSSESRVNIGNLRSGLLAENHFRIITDGASKLYNFQIYFDHSSTRLSEIRSNARRMVREGVKLIFVDYLTLIRHGKPQMTMFERTGEISHGLKAMARELDLPVVVLSQLTRDAEDRRPTLADLRWSGEIEQDADVVILMHRDREEEQGLTYVDVAKQRNGPVRDFKIKFLPEFVRFENVSWRKYGE